MGIGGEEGAGATWLWYSQLRVKRKFTGHVLTNCHGPRKFNRAVSLLLAVLFDTICFGTYRRLQYIHYFVSSKIIIFLFLLLLLAYTMQHFQRGKNAHLNL